MKSSNSMSWKQILISLFTGARHLFVQLLTLIRTNNLALLAFFALSIGSYAGFVYLSSEQEKKNKKFNPAYTALWLPALACVVAAFNILGTKLIRYTVLNYNQGLLARILKYLPGFSIFIAVAISCIYMALTFTTYLKKADDAEKSGNSSQTAFFRIAAWLGVITQVIFTGYSFVVDIRYTDKSFKQYQDSITNRATTLAQTNSNYANLPNLPPNKRQKLFNSPNTTPPPEITNSYTVIFGIICALIAYIMGRQIFKADLISEGNTATTGTNATEAQIKSAKKNTTFILQFLVFASIASYGAIKLLQMILKMYYVAFFNFIGSPVDPSKYGSSYFNHFVLIIIVIGSVMLGAQVFQTTYLIESGKKMNDAEFEKDRCNITNMLLFPYIKPDTPRWNNMSFSDNWGYCINHQRQVFVMTFLQPFYDIFNSIMGILTTIFTNITNIRQAITNVRVFFANMSQELYTKIRNDYIRLAYIKNVFVRIFTKVFDGMYNMFYAFLYTYYTIRSLLSPLLPIASFFCFAPTTPITSTKTIAELQVGDEMPDGSTVLSTMIFSSKNVKMYKYKGTVVAGSHLVFIPQTKLYTRVEDLSDAHPLHPNDYPHDTVICLRTSNNTIQTLNGTLFADYDETSNPIINSTIQALILNHLNHRYLSTNRINTNTSPAQYIDKDASVFYHWAFHPDTLIDGKPIHQYKIGDRIPSSNATVTGTIRTNPHNVHLLNGIYVTGNQIVYDEKEQIYTTVSHHPNSKQITHVSPNSQIQYCHLTTSTGDLVINNTLFTDFEQTSDPTVNEAIDELVIKYKNHELDPPQNPMNSLSQNFPPSP